VPDQSGAYCPPQIERAEILFTARAFALITSHRTPGEQRANEKLMEKVARRAALAAARPMNIYTSFTLRY
jgi:hypothetical protein